jgi:hypothetical protein
MRIGIIAAGNIGATLARKLAASGHEFKLADSKGPNSTSASKDSVSLRGGS